MMLSIISFLVFFLQHAFAWPHKHQQSNGIVHLDYATYQGTPLAAGVTQYLGMRFAAPPLGDLRWRAPENPPHVSGVQNATDFGPICVGINQTSSSSLSEDCLFINVFTPSNATRKSRLPVWFYIQGGGYITNSNADYNGTEVVVASDMNVILVNMNYRVSAFGFLASEKVRADGDLNVGLLDQRKALHWVQKYITEFGGDPDHVVIHGASAGAGSVGLQMTAYGGRNDNLFIGAVAQSPFFPCQMTLSQSEWQFDRFATAAGCSNTTDQLTCLRATNVSVLEAANVASPFPGQTLTPDFYFSPAIDGDLIPDYPYKLFQDGSYVHVPLIVGDETNEGSYFAANATSAAEVSSFLEANCPAFTETDLATANELYPLMPPLPLHAAYFPSASAAYGETTFVCAGILMSESVASQTSGQKSWNYRFNVATTENLAAGLGVPHTFDSAAIFGPEYNGPIVDGSTLSYETYNAEIVPVLMDYYLSFVRTLDPNTLKDDSAPVWEPFFVSSESAGANSTGSDVAEQRLLVETNGTRMEAVPSDQEQRCDFWIGLAGVTEQ